LIGVLDRHGENWFIKQDKNENITGIAPLFDNACSFNSPFLSEEFQDKAMFIWSLADVSDEDAKKENFIMPHFDMFRKLCENYPAQINDLISRTQTLKLDNFTSPRFEKMKAINAEVQSQQNAEKPQKQREPEPPKNPFNPPYTPSSGRGGRR
jgi:hypothetical protein